MIAQAGSLLVVWLVAPVALVWLSACLVPQPRSHASGRPSDRPLSWLIAADRMTVPLMKAEKPWEDSCLGYLGVLRVGDVWHKWQDGHDHTCENHLDVTRCYARSADGVH